ncbi:helix-turn-helix domain-containing protein [Pseudonocardia sp. KRD291]|uniref:helix-turn-helix domain-containing protein n=1 Tax=Pseudonocardia sp. KRD291 TaxID=2792007 RepID=UPI001C4A35D9|nr:helix-turn-helix transcriptional regulator [Pseudonocardia sp. KRD291]MBW0104138.1 helix-turn-helix transcriptional regulator [Pseudonocardia sp. KRD291]
MLLREAIGSGLRRSRTARRRTLRDISRAARVSLGYLSEVERGRKEPSSELLASICEALDVTVAELLAEVAAEMALEQAAPAGFGTRADEVLVPIGQRHAELRLAGRPAGAPAVGSGAANAPATNSPVASVRAA